MRVLCTNDKDFPNVIPITKRVKEGELYNVIESVKCNIQGGLLGYKLAEIDLSDYAPYLYFAANRFAIPVDGVAIEEEEEILELV